MMMMCNFYDKLTPKNQGLVQIGIGAATVLYVIGILPGWVALLAALVQIAHGVVHAGLYTKIQNMISKK